MMLSLFLGMALAACTAVREPVISAGDLAKADSRFAVVPASATVGYSPAPGSRRLFSEAEMERLGKRFGVEGKPHELCFEYEMHKLESKAVLEAIERVIPGAEVEILEISSLSVPEGPLEFSKANLPKPPQSRPGDAVIWRGHVQYAQGRNFTIWVKLRIAVPAQRVLALRDMNPGQQIASADVEIRTVKCFPDTTHWAQTAEEVIGRKLLVAVRAGFAIQASSVGTGEQLVARGDQVTVDVEAGAAHLRIDSKAESAAGLGGVVKLRNPKSGKIFEALVTGKGTAVILAADNNAKVQQ